MIRINDEKKVFNLITKHTTYAMGVCRDSALVHLYWGKRLNYDMAEICFSEFSSRAYSPFDLDEYSSDILPMEYATFGNADTRTPAMNAIYADGSRVTRLEYGDYKIHDGKPSLQGLPAMYCEEGDKVETLTIYLKDKLQNVDVVLSYSVFEDLDAITRSVKIKNNGQRMELTSALSANVDFYGMPQSDILHLDGTWARECAISRNPIVCGNQNVASRYGCSSSMHNPFIAICDKGASENHGNVYGFSLVYSGNFSAGIEVNPYNCGRAYIGINPFNFNYVLEHGEEFQTPEAVLVYSDKGLGGMSRIYHKAYRTRLCRGKYRDANRFILINNWEATYLDFNEEKIVSIAKKASEIGIDTMVLDDGWYGERGNCDSGLGDWYENKNKLPNGLPALASKINDLGMHFGLWFEPEMVNPNSDLFRAHPDWALQVKGRTSTLFRNQLTLDLSRQEVCEYVIDAVTNVLNKANIEYVKWDMNRYMTEAGSLELPAERQGEVMHRYMLGLYYILETLTQRFPNVLFEGCASGGARFDPGILHYMPQVWTSDDSDAVERLNIQYGTSIVYPFSAMGAHVSACPNHQIGRTTPFEKRCNVAMLGQYGFELDLNHCSNEELEIAKKSIETYKELREIFHKGDCYRLKSPFEGNLSVLQFVSEDAKKVILCIESKKAIPGAPEEYISMEALDENALYSCNGKMYGGDYLMSRGIILRNDVELRSQMLIFEKE